MKKKRRKKEMRTIDMQVVLLCAVMAVAATFGFMTGAAAFLDVRLQECDPAAVVGIGCTVGGLLWGILLIANCRKISKDG